MLCSLLVVLGGAIAFTTPPDNSSNILSLARARDAAEMLTVDDRRVRTTDKHLHSLLLQGVGRSTTFASLVAAVSQTDVIVYIEPVSQLPRSLSGRLLMLRPAAGQRYLRIQVFTHGTSSHDLIATIGHELQHALEIARAGDVKDQQGLERLYKQIGRSSAGSHSYDTEAARAAGRVVRAELVS